MVPLIENEIVTKRKWIAQEDFIDLLAISQSAPGILAVNISIFIGYKLRGIRGSIITALGTILPSFIIISPCSFTVSKTIRSWNASLRESVRQW
jgi:chromate transporter